MAGAANPDGEGRVPNITAHSDGMAEWSLSDIAYFFQSGLTPDFDTAGGSMVDVQENLAQLSESDRKVMAHSATEKHSATGAAATDVAIRPG